MTFKPAHPRPEISSNFSNDSYALAKRAQVTLTERWAALYNDKNVNVAFNSMHPGWCDTPGLQSGMPGFREKQKSSLRSSEEGGDTIVWLVGSRHEYRSEDVEVFHPGLKALLMHTTRL